MANREYVMLAKVYEPRLCATRAYGSEKLDGMRGFWDGGISRGTIASAIPWANSAKDGHLLMPPVATGLWSRYGKVIRAPDWFLNALPHYPLDVELYAGLGRFQFVVSAVKKHIPVDSEWRQIKAIVLDKPTLSAFLMDGRINNTNIKMTFKGLAAKYASGNELTLPFERTHEFLLQQAPAWDQRILVLHDQRLLPLAQSVRDNYVHNWLGEIVAQGGEGICIRKASSFWMPLRTTDLMKKKALLDSEGVVIGYKSGEETALGSKLLGMLGSLRLAWQGVEFDLSGFTDQERTFDSDAIVSWAAANPGQILPSWVNMSRFPIGSKITFKYREKTEDGLPKEARYWRKYEE